MLVYSVLLTFAMLYHNVILSAYHEPTRPELKKASVGRSLMCPRDFLWAPAHGPLASLRGSELWAPVLKVVCSVVIMDVLSFRIRGPYRRTRIYFEMWQAAVAAILQVP